EAGRSAPAHPCDRGPAQAVGGRRQARWAEPVRVAPRTGRRCRRAGRRKSTGPAKKKQGPHLTAGASVYIHTRGRPLRPRRRERMDDTTRNGAPTTVEIDLDSIEVFEPDLDDDEPDFDDALSYYI